MCRNLGVGPTTSTMQGGNGILFSISYWEELGNWHKISSLSQDEVVP